MEGRVRHPRLLAVVRTFLYLVAALAGVGLVGVTLSFLGFVAVLSALSFLLVGDVSELLVLLVGGLGLAVLGVAGLVLARITRRVDRFLVRTARVPSPLERVTASYVRGDIDEGELERRLERVLAADVEVDDAVPRSVASVRSPPANGSNRGIGTDVETA